MKKIAVIPNRGKDAKLINTKRLTKFLSDKAAVYMDKYYNALGGNLNFVPTEEIYSGVDYAVVLGGDGTILRSAAQCATRHIPVLGVNLGKIGFVTEVEPDDIENALTRLLNGDFSTEKRMMLRADIKKTDGSVISFYALNDVVVSKSQGEKIINIILSAADEEVNRYRADGLIIATPTGSTGYSISAGGPVVDPRMKLYLATPICPHILSARSAVLPSEIPLKIRLNGCGGALITADGDVQGYISGEDEIIISKSEYDFELIKISGQSFYDTLINKLS